MDVEIDDGVIEEARRRQRRRLGVAAVLATTMIAAAALIFALGGGGGTGSASASRSAKQGRAGSTQAGAARQCLNGQAVSPRLKAHFAVFRRVGTADLSAASAETVANPHVVAFLQLNLSCTQLVRSGSGPVWIVPGRRGACVMSGQAAATIAPRPGQNITGCGMTDGVLQNGEVVRGGQSDGPTILFGLVPDGNTSVTLTFATGTRRRVAVVDNIVRAAVPAGAVTVAFRDAAGAPWSHRYQG